MTEGTIPDPAATARAENDDTPIPLPWRARRARQVAGFVSPAVRRVAAERDIDPATLTDQAGSGVQGRVTLGDLEGLAGVGMRGPAPNRDERVPFNRVQARAGVALLASKRTAAHALTVVLTDYSAVDVVRRACRERFRAEEGFPLTYLPFVARAVIDALADFPLFNATSDEDASLVQRRVGLGIAVDLDHHGLVVPVVHDADRLRLRALACAIDDIARRARSKRLTPDDTAGGTFTITNPGSYGTEISVPIVNRPQVGILSTDGVRKRVVADDDRLAIRPAGYLCLSFDHRVIDGAYAGSFAGRVRDILEGRDWLTEL